jgi:hypothetical protein
MIKIKVTSQFGIPEIFFGMLLAILIFVLGVMFSSAQHPENNSAPNNSAHAAAEQQSAPVTYWKIFGVVLTPIDVFTGLLFVATVGLGIITVYGIKNQSRETRILQRAYISAEPGGISPFLPRDLAAVPTNKTYVGHVGFHNVGRLPARNARWYVDAEYSTNPDYEPVRFGGLIGDGNVISPGEAMTQGSIEKDIPGRLGYFFTWGKIVYDDGFGIERETVFCHRYNLRRLERAKNSGFFRIRARYGRHHDKYNNAT